ncbi:MAG: 50S ribosomal protein L21 [Acidimicrobiia bacterium]|nr:50S ribosomal protein L21 [Acidimicrobiia bacterium]NNF65486.1 50S ribosomal protein L21 [Acidimicrobiia bacterium]
MYAIIRAGGKQSKVAEGDVLDIERVREEDTIKFTPILVVNEDGSVVSDGAALGDFTVTAEILGESKGPKIDIFKYKNKTGYRRRAGHRQKYTTIKVTSIAGPKSAKKAKAKAETKSESKSKPKKSAPAAASESTEEE